MNNNKTSSLISSIRQETCEWIGLSPEHWRNIQDLKNRTLVSPSGSQIGRCSVDFLELIGVDTLEKRLVEYVETQIQDEKQVLGLIMLMCQWKSESLDGLELTFQNVRPLVILLGEMNASYYMHALSIYKSILLEEESKEKVLECLSTLPIANVRQDGTDKGNHAASIVVKGRAYEEMGKFTKALNLYKEIGLYDPPQSQAGVKEKIKQLTPLAEQECIIL